MTTETKPKGSRLNLAKYNGNGTTATSRRTCRTTRRTETRENDILCPTSAEVISLSDEIVDRAGRGLGQGGDLAVAGGLL